jgi:hypothetical protein
VPPASVPCTTGYLCGGGTCANICGANSDCDGANGYTCVGASCKKLLGQGQPCSTGGDCATGICISNRSANICCTSSCTDIACGTTAFCSLGGSGCQTHANELCGSPPGCSADNLSVVPAGSCDGSGNCAQVPVSCLGYLCSSGTCATSCVDDTACDTGHGYHCDLTTTPASCRVPSSP